MNHELGFVERATLLGRRCYFSMGYGVLYLLVLLVNLVLVVWLLASWGKPEPLGVFVGMEILVTLALVGELVFTFCSSHGKMGMWFWIDSLVAALCVLFLAIYLSHLEDGELVELSVAFTVMRYLLQLIRMSVVVRQMSRKNELLNDSVDMELEAWDSTISEDEILH
ncbi:hypothetical protein BASA81_007800 [Batrachochytrium salamandrivorans]|nr:hypothetical protein BASA81_007800 [Batrachochytrium salamandrivorans]